MAVGFFGKLLFKKGASKVSPTITKVEPNVPVTKGQKLKRDLKIATQKSKAAKAVSQSHEEMAHAYKLSIGDEVRKSYSARKIAGLTIPANELALQKAKESLEVARQRFETGIGNITTIVQANALVGEAAHQLINNSLKYKNADAQLYRYTATWPSFVSKSSLASIEIEQ